jgi:peptidoglycan/xylan/chitin deacetylase (PgdA/CDA1 family)
MIIKGFLNALSPPGTGARLSILIFHRVVPTQDLIFPGEMYARRFDEVCASIKSWFNVLPLDLAVSHLKSGSLPARAACITFDDGYADNHDVAMPILLRHGLPATFFISTGFLNGGRMWNDTVIEAVRLSRASSLDLGELGSHAIFSPSEKSVAIKAIIAKIKYLPIPERLETAQTIADEAQVNPPNNLMMTSAQVKTLRGAGMQIGAHTLTHPILASLDDSDARTEIRGSKEFLENLLEERIGLFAYPNGKPGQDYLESHVTMVKDLGFDAAVSTRPGVSSLESDVFQLARFTPWDHSTLRFGIRLVGNLRSVVTRGS